MPNIVILGAGFGGIAAAKTLAPLVRAGKANVIVIDRHGSHVFTPLLYEAATGFVSHMNLGTSALLNAGVTVDVAETLRQWGADSRHATVEGVDWDKKQVLLREGEPVAFDYLIVGLGAETNFFGIAGLQERAYTLKSVRDADRLRQRVHDLLHKREKGIEKHMEIVIGGGGATGVETAAELTMFLIKHVIKGHLKPTDFTVHLVEAQPRVLAAMPPELSAAALDRLKHLGVHVHLDSAVKEVGNTYTTLTPRACKPGETPEQLLCDFTKQGQMDIAADLLIWTGGIRGSMTLEKMGLPLDQRGKRIEVGPTLEVAGRPNVFGIGDSVVLMDPEKKLPVPWLAQAAMRHGELVGRTISARVNGDAALAEQYKFPTYPVVVPLGGKYAIAIFMGKHFIGFSGWLLKEAANLRYFITILPFWTGLKKWWHGALMYSKND